MIVPFSTVRGAALLVPSTVGGAGRRPVEAIHGSYDPVCQPALDSLHRSIVALGDDGLVFLSEGLEDILGRVKVARRAVYANPLAGKVLRAEQFDNGA